MKYFSKSQKCVVRFNLIFSFLLFSCTLMLMQCNFLFSFMEIFLMHMILPHLYLQFQLRQQLQQKHQPQNFFFKACCMSSLDAYMFVNGYVDMSTYTYTHIYENTCRYVFKREKFCNVFFFSFLVSLFFMLTLM